MLVNNPMLKIQPKNNVYNKNTTSKISFGNLSKLKGLSQDTLTISFKGVKEEDLKTKLQNQLSQFEKFFYSDKFLNLNEQDQEKICKAIISTLDNASNNNIELNINKNAYINRCVDMLEVPENQLNQYSTIYNAKNLLQQLYVNSSKDTQIQIESVFTKYINAKPSDSKASLISDFFFDAYPNKEKEFAKLVEITTKINSFEEPKGPDYLKAREELFNQELLILYQEITEPDKYIDRAKQMYATGPWESDSIKAQQQLRTSSLKGLLNQIGVANALNISLNKISFEKLSNTLLDITNNISDPNITYEMKMNSLTDLIEMYNNVEKKQQEKIEQATFNIVINGTSNDNLQLIVDFFDREVDKNKDIISNLNNYFLSSYNKPGSTTEEKRSSLISMAKLESKEIYNLINNILSDPKSDESLKSAAVWAVGLKPDNKYQKTLIDIIDPENLNKDETLTDNQLKLKEMALYALSQFNNILSSEILTEVSFSESSLAELAEALIDDKKSSTEPDYYINKYLKDSKEKELYKLFRDKYAQNLNELSIKEKNFIDKTLIPFRIFIPVINNNGGHLSIFNDTTTSIAKEEHGKRYGFNFFFDCAKGLGGGNGSIEIPKFVIQSPRGSNVIGHEWGHVIQFILNYASKEHRNKIIELYEKSNNNFMDFYSAINNQEYFAQANKAFLTTTLPYTELIDVENYQKNYNDTRSYLKRKDPEMYKFLKKLYAEFNNMNISGN